MFVEKKDIFLFSSSFNHLKILQSLSCDPYFGFLRGFMMNLNQEAV